MSRNSEVEREQAHVAVLYARLDELREQARERLKEVLSRGASGTHQNRSERDLFAVMYQERLSQLEAVEPGLCFGRLDTTGGDRLYVGRIGLTDEGHESMLVDWRAPAAEPFYRATPAESLGVIRRRHLRTKARQVIDVEDDVFDVDELTDADRETLGGGGALLAALTESRTGRMRDIVATIQAEQDRIIRADSTGVLVVQGGPGTGKTAVALHRAAYLLYTKRERLARNGVLVVGPGSTFLRYIEQVLPSLGETGVVLATLEGLLPGIKVGATESLEVARLKSDPRMARVVAAAVAAHQRVPSRPMMVEVEDLEITLDPSDLAAARARARRSRRRHNRARYLFAKNVLRTVMGRVAETDPELAKDRTVVRAVMQSDEFRAVIDACWPRITMTELIAELFTPKGIAEAGRDVLSRQERDLLVRERGSAWTAADVPLLDEAWSVLGDPEEVLRVAAERRRLRLEKIYAQEAIAASGYQGQVDADALAERFGAPGAGGRTITERASGDPDWEFGHLIVDEAQELSPMAWRMLVRRCPIRSMTIVGDVDQLAAPWGTRRWSETLDVVAPDRWETRELTVNYRTPSEIMAVAADVLAAADPQAVPPSSVRDAGSPPQAHRVWPGEDRNGIVVDTVATARTSIGDGRLAVLTSRADFDAVREALTDRFGNDIGIGAAGLDAPIAVLEIGEAKGLEFDGVVLVEPGGWLTEGERGLRDLYVALTRATQRLDVVYSRPLPGVLSRLADARSLGWQRAADGDVGVVSQVEGEDSALHAR
ncbi:MAG TPA: ATP-binding domain-containing protein [Mycobacteriales bacterium]|nr:ATP-binding domain-containing protein [Mycobacteriales bacterium]